MIQRLKEKGKEQKGFTLIELLAVIVILGIIAAIAIPSILTIISNSKKDAFVADARQMISSARTAVSADTSLSPSSGSEYVDLQYLIDKGYLDSSMKDPYNGTFTTAAANAGKASTAVGDMSGSYVQINSNGTYSVYLTEGSTGSSKSIGTSGAPVAEKDLARGSVTP